MIELVELVVTSWDYGCLLAIICRDRRQYTGPEGPKGEPL
jgi:hypothetical protein